MYLISRTGQGNMCILKSRAAMFTVVEFRVVDGRDLCDFRFS